MAVKPLFTKYARLELGGGTIPLSQFQCESTSIGITSEGGSTQSLTTLCPDGSFSEAEARTYNLEVSLVQDVEQLDSFLFWLLQHDGETVPFTYYPKTDNKGAPVGYGFKGMVTVQPPSTIGGAESGNFATAEVTLPLQGKYTIVDAQGNEVILGAPVAITGVTAGTPGTFAPVGATLPANLAALKADAVIGDTALAGATTAAWTTGQYIVLADNSEANWNGTIWVQGRHA